jgi:hypothetical protein
MRMHEPQIRIANHDHSAVFTWIGTHIIAHGSKRSNFGKRIFKVKIQLFVFVKNLAKQLVLVAQSISSSATHIERHSGDRSSLTSESESKMCHENLHIRQRSVKSPVLR